MANREDGASTGGDRPDAGSALDRRTYVGAVAGALAALAGCSSGGDGDPATTRDPTTPTVTATGTSTDASTGEQSTTAERSPAAAAPSIDDVRIESPPVRQTRPATVTVAVANDGSAAADAVVSLALDGETADTATVTVDAGARETAAFTVRDPRVGDRTLAATLTVDGEERDAATTTVSVEQYPPSFVDRDGTDFVVDGDPFRYAGVNNNHLPVAAWGRQYVDRLFASLADHGVSVVRTWAFPPAWTDADVHLGPGRFDDDWFAHFDYVLLAAKRHDVRLVLPLVNNWGGPDDAPTTAAYAAWSDTADGRNDFFDDDQATQYYYEYVEHVLTHENQYTGVEYRDDPTVAMWEVGNEMEYHGDRRGEPLTDWYDAAAAHVKSVDDTHLVGTGMAGATGDVYESWNVRNAYVETHRSEHVDACCFHTYPIKRWQGETTVRDQSALAAFVRTHVREAHEQVGKPAYLGEFGAVVDPDAGLPVSKRDECFRTATRVAREEGLDGLLFWFAELRDPKDAGATRDYVDNPLAIYPDESATWTIIDDYAATLEE